MDYFATILAVTPVPDWASLLPLIIPSIISILLSAVIAVLAYLLRSDREHNREIERQLSDKKYDTYKALLDGFEVILHGDESQRKDNIAHLNDMGRNLLFYGSDAVIESYQVYLRLATSEEMSQNLAKFDETAEKLIGNILLNIRRDMGNKKTKMKSRDLFYQFDLVIERTGLDVINNKQP